MRGVSEGLRYGYKSMGDAGQSGLYKVRGMQDCVSGTGDIFSLEIKNSEKKGRMPGW